MNNKISLFNKYRPMRFSEIVGQKPIVNTLQSKVASGQIPKASLFYGVRGTGKTTMARIVSKAINCENPTPDGPCCKCKSCLAIDSEKNPDVVELDAASNNKVADIEEIIENAQYKPFGKQRVLILDEVHMLSIAAFNKLLKIVEDPPKDCNFIFCTTERQKIPATILSRCTQYEFRAVSGGDILDNLKKVCGLEKIVYEDDALCMIAKAAGGSLRDSLSILEQLSYGERLTAELVSTTLGIATDEAVFSILAALAEGNPQIAVCYLSDVLSSGKNITTMLRSMVDTLMDVINIHNGLNIRSMAVTREYQENIQTLADAIDSKTAINHIQEITAVLSSNAGYSLDFAAQIAILKLVNQKQEENILEKRIEALEQEILSLRKNGMVVYEETEETSKEELQDVINEAVIPFECNPETIQEKDTFIGASDYNPVPFDETDAFVPDMEESADAIADTEPVKSETVIPMVPKEPDAVSKDKAPAPVVEIPGGTIVRKETEAPKPEDNTSTEEMNEDDGMIAFDDFSSFGKLSFGGWARQS